MLTCFSLSELGNIHYNRGYIYLQVLCNVVSRVCMIMSCYLLSTEVLNTWCGC